MDYADSVGDVRSVARAVQALARTVRSGGDVERAADRLELNARRAVDVSERGFGPEEAPEDDELLAVALTQLSIGSALCQAEHTFLTRNGATALDSVSSSLESTADLLENLEAPPAQVLGFDSVDGLNQSVLEAGQATLDEMAASAADVAAATLNRLAKPIIDRVPDDLKENLGADLPGRLAGIALRAVRRGLELLQRLVNLELVERIRADIDNVLDRLGKGQDRTVLAGWAIGVTSVRAGLVEPADGAGTALRRELDELAARFAKLCKLLRRIALVVAGLGATLAFIHVTLPHAAAITAIGLVVVLGAVIVLGRDYTGANDLPGRVRGVRLLFEGAGHAHT